MSTASVRRSNPAEILPDASRQGRVAIILNKNAKRVGRRVRRQVEAIAPPGADVFFTESLEQARFITRRVVDSGYGLVVTGGGDGTVANTIAQVLSHAEARGLPVPRFAVLKLGTGNAVADFLGAGDYRDDLRQLESAVFRPMNLLNIDGVRSPFAGFGWDAFILNNYDRMRTVAERFFLTRALFKTVGGYLVAGVGKSVPELMVRRPSWQVRVINTGGIGLRVDSLTGQVVERIAPGAVAYEGRVRLACFGTAPYYGFKFNIMPFAAKRPGMFQLRLVDMSPMAALRRLHAAWNGRLDHPGVTDLQLTACRLEFDEPAPLQIAGDAAGERMSVEVRVDGPVECARFAR